MISSGSYNKLQLYKMVPFPIIKHINDNAHILDLPTDINFSFTFNILDLYTFKPLDEGHAQLSEFESSSSKAEGTWCRELKLSNAENQLPSWTEPHLHILKS